MKTSLTRFLSLKCQDVLYYSIYQKKSVKQGGKFSLLAPCLARPLFFFFSVFVFSQEFFYLLHFFKPGIEIC